MADDQQIPANKDLKKKTPPPVNNKGWKKQAETGNDGTANTSSKTDNNKISEEKLTTEDLTTHNQLTRALHNLDLLNAQLGVAGAILVSMYHLQKQKEAAATANRGYAPPAGYPPQYANQGMAQQPMPQPTYMPAPTPQPAYQPVPQPGYGAAQPQQAQYVQPQPTPAQTPVASQPQPQPNQSSPTQPVNNQS